MCTADQVEVVFLQENADDIGTEGVAHSPFVVAPALDVDFRVRPQQVAEESLVWDVGGPDDASDLVEAVEFGTESAVHAYDLVVDDRCDRQAIEALGKRLPQLDAESSLALIVKAIYTIDRRALVIPT